MGAEITEEQALERLRSQVGYHCNISKLAEKFKVSPPFMSAVLAGNKGMTKPMLDDIGVRKETKLYDTKGDQ